MPLGASRNAGPAGPAGDAIVRLWDRQTARARGDIVARSPAWAVSRGHLDDWSRQAAAEIADAPLPPGSLVGLVATQAPAFLAGFLGVRRAGCTALLLDGAAPAREHQRAGQRMGATALLVCGADDRLSRFRAVLSRIADATPIAWRPDWAAVKLTSGSTGEPRGVAVSAEALLADEAALARTMDIRDGDRLVAALPLSHSYGFTTLAMAALVRGVQLVVPDDGGPFAPLVAATALEATVFPTVPHYVQAVLQTAAPPRWPASLRLTLTAGAPMPPETAARFRRHTGRPIHVFYGSSECGGICYDPGGDAAERGTVGAPVDGVTIALEPTADAFDGGILSVRSAAVAETYLPHPAPELADGRFQTADLAAWRDGEIALLGRADRVINFRGFKISPAEVERIITTLPGVEDVLVSAAPGADGASAIVRAVVECRDGSIKPTDVADWCRARLADHKVPRSIVVVPALPRTSRGKIDRDAIAALTAAGLTPDDRRS